jgi:O-methyltransferase
MIIPVDPPEYETVRKQPPWRYEGSDIFHHRLLPSATLAPWLNDKDFLSSYLKVRGHTLVDLYRSYELWQLAKQTIKIPGDILEVGAWRGGSGAILAQAAHDYNKKVFLADTFYGVVKAGINDTAYKGGEHADTSPEIVKQLIDSLQLTNVKLLEGVFPDDTHQQVDSQICLLHCDVDVYMSAKDIVTWCLPRMPIGGMMIFDDYGFYGAEGITKFCDELKSRNDLIFFYNLNGHAIFVKIL